MDPDELVVRYQAQYAAIRARTVAAMVAAWVAYGGLDDDDADRFIAAAARYLVGGQRAVGQLLAGYLGLTVRSQVGGPALPRLDRTRLTTDQLRGVPFADVYRRPVVTARTELGRTGNLDQAMERAQQRVSQTADTDLALAQRDATVQLLADDDRIVGYRRVLTGQSCAFCATASTQRYWTGDLMPLHNHCDCGVAPIFGTVDPGQIINSRLLEQLKAAGGSQYWNDRGIGVDEDGVIRRRIEVEEPVLREDGRPRTRVEYGDPVEVAVRQHGELGPVLVDARHRFTGPDDLAA